MCCLLRDLTEEEEERSDLHFGSKLEGPLELQVHAIFYTLLNERGLISKIT